MHCSILVAAYCPSAGGLTTQVYKNHADFLVYHVRYPPGYYVFYSLYCGRTFDRVEFGSVGYF